MVQPEIRRASDPRIVRKLHFAIKKTCEQKQAPIFERVFRALSIDKVQITRSRVELQLKNSIRDGLILENSYTSKKSDSGALKTAYRTPSIDNFYENYEDDGHDWYCWVCHREGEVYLCTTCPRVIHKKCAEVTQEELEEDFVCYCCKDLKSTKNYGKKELQELATMLGYTVERMKSKCEELWTSPTEEEEPAFRLFVYNDANLDELEKKVRKKEFNSLAKFHYEIEWLFHNAVIFYGGDHKVTRLARMVVLDGQNELSQIDICSECYIASNERTKNWFAKPCKPPHRIVYARLGSDPPWPAKVMRDNEEGTSADVRFFGNPYQRAWIPHRNIWELDDKPANKKRSKALELAEDELKIYTRLLAKKKPGKEEKPESEVEEAMEEEEEEVQKPSRPTPSRGRRKSKTKQEISDQEDDEEEEEEEVDDNDDDDDEEMYDYEPMHKRKRKKDKKIKSVKDKPPKAKGKRGRPRKSESHESQDEKQKTRTTKAEQRFRELQEAKLKEFKKQPRTKELKVEINRINKNLDGDSSSSSDESPDMQLAKQIKMTDDYKMIEKLQERIRTLEKQYDQGKNDYESAQAEVESSRLDLAAEKQKSKRLSEQLDKSQEVINERTEKIKIELVQKKQEEIDLAIEEERKRNELEFEVRLKEALTEERSNTDVKVQEALEKAREVELTVGYHIGGETFQSVTECLSSKVITDHYFDYCAAQTPKTIPVHLCDDPWEKDAFQDVDVKFQRVQLDSKVKVLTQRDQEEMQRKFERYKQESEMKHKRAMDDTVRNLKIEAEEMTKRAMQENLRRIQVETERVVANAKKKSWCSNCTKEAFYHCCWNTNYCSIDCQRVHWVSHRYQCTREMMSTCRSCQQRQNFPSGGLPPPQVPPK